MPSFHKIDNADDDAGDRISTSSAPELLGINEVVDLTGISAFTIRYYDKCGFFPNLIRGKRGVRSFRSEDVDQLRLVDALRRSGLSIEGITFYVRLSKRGDATLADRLKILQDQTAALEYQIAEARNGLLFLRGESDAINRELAEKPAKILSKQSSETKTGS